MIRFLPLLAALAGCWGDNAYIVEGVVVEVHGDREVVVDHQEIKGYMGPMTMPFAVRDPALLNGVVPGDKIYARLMVEPEGSYFAALRVTGHGPAPETSSGVGPAPLRPGEVLPAVVVEAEDGAAITIGAGQDKPTAVAFMYTRCPIPEFCPLLVTRFQALQEQVGTDARLVTVTIDPDHDTREVLAAFSAKVGAKPETWRFARTEPAAMADLAQRASLSVMPADGEIVHGSRLLVLDREGRLVERYDDNRFPLDRVVEQLKTGGPPAPPGSDGTLTP